MSRPHGLRNSSSRESRRRFFRSCASGRIAKMHGNYATRRRESARSHHRAAGPEEDPHGQGARHLRDRRGFDAHRDHRPPVGLRRGAAGPDSRQGPRAQFDLELLVRAHHAHRAESPHGPPRRRSGQRSGRARHAGRSCRHREAAQDRAARGRGARLRDRLGLEGLPEDRRDLGHQTTGGAASRRRNCRRRCSRRRPRRPSASTTRPSASSGRAARRRGARGARARYRHRAVRIRRRTCAPARHHHRGHQVRVRAGCRTASWCSSTRC